MIRKFLSGQKFDVDKLKLIERECDLREGDDMESQRRNWTREETVLAFDLYCRIPFSKISKSNKQIIELAGLNRENTECCRVKNGKSGKI